ncbi:MAG: hypothetical protein JJT81_19500 [Rubellimicrobium sp.]|nr:hypothetical protein [Rubellimicrobium sp.]
MRGQVAILTLLFSSLSLPAASQNHCDGPRPVTLPACMVGHWAGFSDMADRLQAFLDTLPEEVAAIVLPEAAETEMLLDIFPDGFFVAAPISFGVDVTDFSSPEPVSYVIDTVTQYGAGWLLPFPETGVLDICHIPGTGTVTATAEGVSVSTDADGSTFWPDAPVTYRCDGDVLSVRITLPGIGPVTYTLFRAIRAPFADAADHLYFLYNRAPE